MRPVVPCPPDMGIPTHRQDMEIANHYYYYYYNTTSTVLIIIIPIILIITDQSG